MSNFNTGQQPCLSFRNAHDEADHYFECRAPFTGDGRKCYEDGGKVARCANCGHDHHAGGYETCVKPWPVGRFAARP